MPLISKLMSPATPLTASQPLTADELINLWTHLHEWSALAEIGVLLASLGLAWFLVRVWRGKEGVTGSIWFGRHVVDGVLFPVLALCFALGMRRLLIHDVPPAVFRVAVPVLMSLALIRLTVKVLKAAFPASQTVRVIERTVSWLVWLGTVMWVTGVLPLVLDELDDISFKVGATHVSVRNLIEGSISAVLVLILSLSLSSAIETRLLRGGPENLSLRKIAANALRALFLTVGLLIALSVAGIDLTTLSVLGGALGVGVGFGLQKLAANYVSGFVILAERSLRIGDLVKVDNFEGRITDINTRYTVLRSISGRESIVPNELLITQRVENASLADTKILLTTVVQVAYGSDLDAVRPALNEAVKRVPRVLADPEPSIHLSAFAPDGLELTVAFWIADPENGQMGARSEVNLAILATLNRMGVEIPFPQRVVHQAPQLEVSSAAR